MHHDGQPRARRRGHPIASLTALIAAFMLVQTPLAGAAEQPADIRAKERSDPAAGEVIILNRRKSTSDKSEPGESVRATTEAAPDPYAPRPPEARAGRGDGEGQGRTTTTGERPPGRAAPSPDDARRASETPPERPLRRRAASEPAAAPSLPPPPLPSLNRQTRPRQWARTGDDRDAFAREQVRRPPAAYRQERDFRGDDRVERWREAPPRWGWSDRYRRNWREAPPREFANRRPWRACRRLARLCEDGYERACWSWQRRCD